MVIQKLPRLRLEIKSMKVCAIIGNVHAGKMYLQPVIGPCQLIRSVASICILQKVLESDLTSLYPFNM